MSLADPGPVRGKRCFAYCGDDLCDCELSPRYQSCPACNLLLDGDYCHQCERNPTPFAGTDQDGAT